jgi:hypothetical protein
LGKIETPFFGVSQKRKRRERRKKYVILRSAERRACGDVWGGGWGAPHRASPQPPPVCTTSARRRWRDNYVALLLQNYKCAPFETWGIGAEVKKVGSRDIWYVEATADMLAAGRGELRKAPTEIVKRAVENG